MWLKDGRPLSDTLKIIKVPGSMSILHIQRLTAADSGTYTCVASNKAGTASVSKDMVVYGKYVLLRNNWRRGQCQLVQSLIKSSFSLTSEVSQCVRVTLAIAIKGPFFPDSLQVCVCVCVCVGGGNVFSHIVKAPR